ncbi:MarR family transcriptional regulator [Listeria aquatica]|uniref:MarR family transcriptional regulator n=1 Tax=Listeria aquatica TaxID=1494960 RepID=A0A841ZQY7_9LIST|nr:MarR family transcriptional regulator [Listeria aquatica]MBC1521937.1 MarR family transcriptional regulator [Listeria aquatica]
MNHEERLLAGFRDVYNKLVWLNKSKMENSLSGYKPAEVHCLEFIGKNNEVNVTKLAEAFYMTRSAMSKMTKKLTEKGVIESYQKPENKKEIYFRLTEKGREVDQIHTRLHQEFQERDKPVFDSITRQELKGMLKFVDRYNQHLDKEMNKQKTKSKNE